MKEIPEYSEQLSMKYIEGMEIDCDKLSADPNTAAFVGNNLHSQDQAHV